MIFRKSLLALVFAAALLASGAQGVYAQSIGDGFNPTASSAFTATTSSADHALPAGALSAWLVNSGTVDVYFKLGTTAQTATTSSLRLPAGFTLGINLKPYSGASYSHIALITGSSTASVIASTGSGPPPFGALQSSGGGGGASDVNVTGFNSVAPSVGNGTTDTGTLRVTLSSDSTGQTKLAAGSAVIGHVIADSGSTTAVTQATAANLKGQVQIISGMTNAATSALAANLVVHSGAAVMADFEVAADSTLSGAAWWLMFYDATSAPADGAVTPYKCYALASGQTTFSGAFPTPLPFTAGVTMGVSTTGCFTKTASTHAFLSADWQ